MLGKESLRGVLSKYPRLPLLAVLHGIRSVYTRADTRARAPAKYVLGRYDTAAKRSDDPYFGGYLHEIAHFVSTNTPMEAGAYKEMGRKMQDYSTPKRDFDEVEACVIGHQTSALLGYPTDLKKDLQNGGLRVFEYSFARKVATAIAEDAYLRARHIHQCVYEEAFIWRKACTE